MQKGDIRLIEDVQKSFTRKIFLHGKEAYWDRLRSLNLYSLERRRERYRIIYMWKVLENLVPNLSNDHSKVKTTTSLRNGRLCVVPSVCRTASSRIQSLREGSFSVNGAQLFNSLPRNLRDMSNVELPVFKRKLDKFLATIPDEPLFPGYTEARRAELNSLLHMVPAANR